MDEMEDNSRVKDTTDRISLHPESIAHHILSFLDFPIDLVRMSVLSKDWFALTDSFPILDFRSGEFVRAIRAYGTDYGLDHFKEIFSKTFYVYGIQNLKKVWFSNLVEVDRIDIEALNLFEFHLFERHGEGREAPSINMASCKLLKM
ncbi:F-box domain containing protein [Tanacetum coccineum]